MNKPIFATSIKTEGFRGALVLFIRCATPLLGASRVARALVSNRVTASIGLSDFQKIPIHSYTRIYDVLVDYWSEEEAWQYLGKKFLLRETPCSYSIFRQKTRINQRFLTAI